MSKTNKCSSFVKSGMDIHKSIKGPNHTESRDYQIERLSGSMGGHRQCEPLHPLHSSDGDAVLKQLTAEGMLSTMVPPRWPTREKKAGVTVINPMQGGQVGSEHMFKAQWNLFFLTISP